MQRDAALGCRAHLAFHLQKGEKGILLLAAHLTKLAQRVVWRES
jgi:hypothetical protein